MDIVFAIVGECKENKTRKKNHVVIVIVLLFFVLSLLPSLCVILLVGEVVGELHVFYSAAGSGLPTVNSQS